MAQGEKNLVLYSILSSGESPDAQSRELPVALNHIEIVSILAVTGTILPKRYANVIIRQEQKKTIFSHATSVGNKRKLTEDRIFLSYPIFCPL